MHRTRRVMGLAVIFAMAASLMVLVAAPAQAASGANVALLNPYCGAGAGFGTLCPGGISQNLSSHDGLTAKLTAVAYGGDDAMSAHTALFFVKSTSVVGTEPWFLVGTDSTPAVPDGGAGLLAANPAWPTPPPGFPGNLKWKAFEVDFNTQAMPGGIAGNIDVSVVVCGEGTTSFDALGAFDPQDNNRSATGLLVPILDCSNDLGATIGFDFVSDVVVNNTLAVVELPDYPNTGYHGDSVPINFFVINAVTTPGAQEVAIHLCEDPDPNNVGADFVPGSPGVFSSTWSGGGTDCAMPGGGEVFMTGGPTLWSASFGASGFPDFLIPGLANTNVRLEVDVDDDLSPFGVIFPTRATSANQYIIPTIAADQMNTIGLVWDYQDGPGNRDCLTGATDATSVILPWTLTDSDGDGAEGLAIAPAPDAGALDIDDGDNPVLKVCTKGAAFSLAGAGIQIAYQIDSGPGGIDADTPDYLEPNAFVCGPATPFCSGGFGYVGPVLNGGYARPGSISDLPLVDPLGRGFARVCGVRACQHSDLTDLAIFSGLGSDHAQVNSATTGTTTYRACVDLNGNRACEANELSARATMTWTPGGRNHNHVWKTGTAGVDGHSGQSTVAAPAGGTVSITGWFHDAGHNGVAAKPAIWRIGLNAPGHFVSTETTTLADGSATAVIGSSVLDAARTTPVFFCGDGDADGICDFTPAEIEINWGGVVTSTSISSFAVNPTIGVFGTDFVAAGTLLDGSAAPVSSATVSIQRRTLGSNDWVTIRDVITNGTGAFSATDADLAHNSDYRAVFAGNVSYTGSSSDSDRAWVRVGIAMNVSDPTVFAGQGVRISGRVLPAHPGDVVTLQVLDNGRGWKNIASARLSAASTYAFSVLHNSSKSLLFRVTYPTQGILNAWNVSRNLRVTWA